MATEVEGADKRERVEEPSPGVGRSLRGTCNESPAMVSVIEFTSRQFTSRRGGGVEGGTEVQRYLH